MWPFSTIANAFRQRRRGIFWFWDGARERAIDPMIPFRILAQHEKFDWDTTPALIDLGNLEAMGITADAVRKAFDIKPLDASGKHGLTESECVQLVIRFVDWMQGVKKKGSISRSSAPPTDSPLEDSATPTSSPSS